MKVKNIKIDNIIIENRVRKDMGDINSLSKDIKENGLISPILITDTNRLIAGHRRLTAYSLLGHTEIPCNIVSMINDKHELKLEYSENEMRKNFTNSEKVAMLELLTPKQGGDRPSENIKKPTPSDEGVGNLNETEPKSLENIRYNDRVKAVGFSSRATADRIKVIVKNGTERLNNEVDANKISITLGSKIAKLSEENQEKAIQAIKKYGNNKWWYYELPQTLKNNLEKKLITEDECEGFMISLRNGKTTSEKIVRDIQALIKTKNKYSGIAKAEKIYDKEKKDSKIQKIEFTTLTSLLEEVAKFIIKNEYSISGAKYNLGITYEKILKDSHIPKKDTNG